MTRPFRFGLLLETRDTTRNEIVALARRAQDEGYDIVLGTDHLGRLAAAQVLQTAAEATSLRIGTLVLNNDFRHPVILAQELAALDVVTDGRLEIGLGAGWAKTEYDDASMSFDRPGKRLARLQASVAMLKQSLGEGRIDHDSSDTYGRIRIAVMPQSRQRPYPPFLVGGGGPRVLSFAAREAQIVGLDPRALPEGGHLAGDVTEAAIEEKVAWIRAAAGDRLGELDINLIVFDVDPGFRDSGRPSIDAPNLTDDEIVASPHYLVGDTERMVDALVERRERWGINYLAVKVTHMDALGPVIARVAGR